MQITDHDTHHYGKSSGFKFWVQFETMTGEKETYIDFADFIEWLVAAGEFDGYDDSTDDGEAWRYVDRAAGRCESYTFNEVVSEFMLTGDYDRYLSEYLRIKATEQEEWYWLHKNEFVLGQGYVRQAPRLVSKDEAMKAAQYRNVWIEKAG